MKLSKLLAGVALTLGTLSATYPLAGYCSTKSGSGMNIWFDTGGPVGGAYNTIVQNGAEQACVDLGCDIRFLYSNWSPQKMIENFNRAMSSSPDGIVVMGHPGDDAFEKLIREARDSGIQVTSSDTELPRLMSEYQSEGFGYAGTDNRTRGTMLASETLRRYPLKAGDRALVWGLKSKPNRGLSTLGMIDTLEEAGLKVDYMEISAELDKDPTLGMPLMTAYLSRHADTKLIMIDHGALTGQLENFLRAAGIGPNEIVTAGFSLSPASATAMQRGYINLIGDGQPFLQGYLPVVQLVMSKRYGFSGLQVDTGGGFITKENIDMVAPLAKKGLR